MNLRITDTERRAFFTPKTLAAYLAISERTVRSMLAAGTIASYRVEGARRIDPADVDAYLAGHRDRGYAGSEHRAAPRGGNHRGHGPRGGSPREQDRP